METTKCENCGASLQIDTENAMKFCPYCGNIVKAPDSKIEFEKYKMKHEEQVRQQIVKENREDSAKDIKTGIAIAIGGIIIGLLIMILPRLLN